MSLLSKGVAASHLLEGRYASVVQSSVQHRELVDLVLDLSKTTVHRKNRAMRRCGQSNQSSADRKKKRAAEPTLVFGSETAER